MRCGFCGKEIPDEVDLKEKACGACRGACRKIHCPCCGYANPAIPAFLRRSKKPKEAPP